MRLGLYGGSFDPVHMGHLLVAQAAMDELRLDQLMFIPAAQSPFKPDQSPAPASERVKMLRLALSGHAWYRVDTQEVTRGGLSFTIDTVRSYVKTQPGAELFYLIGADHIPKLHLWREAEALAGLVQFVVIPRPGETIHPLPHPYRLHFLKGFPLQLSSSQIRERVRRGLEIRHLVPDSVRENIRNNGLYLDAGTGA